MKNVFEKTYADIQAIKAAMNSENSEIATKANGDYEAMRQHFKKQEPLFSYVYNVYRKALSHGNELPDFEDGDIVPGELVSYLKKMGVKKFTYSARYTGAIRQAMELQEAGAKIVGMVYIKNRNCFLGEEELKEAMMFEIN